ncbi:hypothetical protein WA026_012017 [Henosepilachna vigintioctopunctata]|uniref:Uncharacterized protein n=1 Tax=Henosepilachna vigintioctopunctata TaxID=420089 RepID=A0AAW1V5X0_9CUCU
MWSVFSLYIDQTQSNLQSGHAKSTFVRKRYERQRGRLTDILSSHCKTEGEAIHSEKRNFIGVVLGLCTFINYHQAIYSNQLGIGSTESKVHTSCSHSEEIKPN